jgi:hypothetical protein
MRTGVPQVDPAKYTDDKRIEGCLKTVREMSLGRRNPNERWNVIRWLVRWLPPSMLEAIKAKNKDKVQELGMVAGLSNVDILQWITDKENQEFLADALEDVRLLITGEATEALAEASVIKNGQFIQRRLAAQQAQAERERAAIDKHNNPPEPGDGNQSVLDATLPTTPVVEAKPIPPTPPAPPAV